MSEPFVGEIKVFAGTYPPQGWADCDGQLLAISQFDALFSLFGTFYGGDGRTTFGLPDLRGRVPVHMGQGPGLSNRQIGVKGGSEKVSLTQATTPTHSHAANATSDAAGTDQPGGALYATAASEKYASGGNAQAMNAAMVGHTGGSQGHENMAPYQVVRYIVALYGIYPSKH